MEHHEYGTGGPAVPPSTDPFEDPFEDDLPLTASLPRITGTGSGIDWPRLESAARAAMTRAYVPYSSFPVGAAALVEDGRIVVGCNVENASLGLTLCAECSLVSQLQMTGGGRLLAFYCVGGDGQVLMPCGRCRQLLHEFHAPGMLLMGPDGELTMDQVLPHAFGPADLTGPMGRTTPPGATTPGDPTTPDDHTDPSTRTR